MQVFPRGEYTYASEKYEDRGENETHVENLASSTLEKTQSLAFGRFPTDTKFYPTVSCQREGGENTEKYIIRWAKVTKNVFNPGHRVGRKLGQ